MSKISTEDCVKFLVSYIPKSEAKEWKRRNKWKDGDFIRRGFENILTGHKWVVTEEAGSIIDASPYVQGIYNEPKSSVVKKNPNPVYYAIHEFDGFMGLSVTDGNHFDKRHCQSDWTPKEVDGELERLGYPGAEDMEAEISFYNEVTDIDDLKMKLASSPVFKFSPAFQKFLQEHESEEFKIIPI